MIKERELLERAMSMIDYRYAPNEAIALTREISGLLAQPEHIPDVGNMVTQEPVYWENEKKALLNEIEQLLAQPEQEPVAWIYDISYGDNGLFVECVTTDYWEIDEHLELSNCSNIRPLYASPPKREHLSDEQVCEILIKKEWKGFVELVRQIEKAHGIGGEE